MASVQFVVGNTYARIPAGKQEYSRNGRILKEHDWTLYVDVVQGDPDVIQHVSFRLPTFQPETFVSSSPVAVRYPNGSKAWRFATRQQSYGSVMASIQIRGSGGSSLNTTHQILLQQSTAKHVIQTFHERRGISPLRMMPVPRDQKFGIELELTADPSTSPQDIADQIGAYVANSYGDGRQTLDMWKIVPDSSIVCSVRQPNCHTFELVSPILQRTGLDNIHSIIAGLKHQPLQVNKSMGFHVHIDVESLSLGQLIKVCQNFIKYEDVIDTFMPPSRRTGSPECDQYFQSCVTSIRQDTNQQRHRALAACGDIGSLARMMNRHGRFYKLNLQNLVTGRQPTLEFRQHSATINYHKISAWVRFCVALVRNSARLAAPSPFKESKSSEDKFDALFMFVIKDRALRKYYRERQQDHDKEEDHCCSDCAAGGTCSQKTTVYRIGYLNVERSD